MGWDYKSSKKPIFRECLVLPHAKWQLYLYGCTCSCNGYRVFRGLGSQSWVWLFRLNFPNNSCWIADCKMKFWNIFCHYATSSDGTSSSDGLARQYNHVAPKPTILSNNNWRTIFWPFYSVSQERVKGVSSRIKRTVGSHHSSGTDKDGAGVNEGCVTIDITTFTKPNRDEFMPLLSVFLETIPDIESIVNFCDRSVNVRLILEQYIVFFLRCSWRRQRSVVFSHTGHRLEGNYSK